MSFCLGAHVDKTENFLETIKEGYSKGYNCMQIFSGPKLRYAQGSIKVTKSETLECKEFIKKHKLKIFIHGRYVSYISNLNSADQIKKTKTRKSIVNELDFCQKMGFKGVVYHVSSKTSKNDDEYLRIIAKKLDKILENFEKIKMIFEHTVNGYSFNKLAKLRNMCSQKNKIVFCIDTAHLWGKGIIVNENLKQNLYKLYNNLDGKIKLVHLNGSTVKFGSMLDRHGKIFDSKIPTKLLLKVVKFCVKNKVCMVLETKPESTREDEVKKIKEKL